MKTWLIIGAIFVGLAILFGSFGAHGLKAKVSAADLVTFEKGIRYQMYHALGLLILGGIGFHISHDLIQIPAYLFIAGIIIFSGSLYFLVLTNTRWLGAITPIGGVCFIVGWFLLAYNLYRS